MTTYQFALNMSVWRMGLQLIVSSQLFHWVRTPTRSIKWMCRLELWWFENRNIHLHSDRQELVWFLLRWYTLARASAIASSSIEDSQTFKLAQEGEVCGFCRTDEVEPSIDKINSTWHTSAEGKICQAQKDEIKQQHHIKCWKETFKAVGGSETRRFVTAMLLKSWVVWLDCRRTYRLQNFLFRVCVRSDYSANTTRKNYWFSDCNWSTNIHIGWLLGFEAGWAPPAYIEYDMAW